MIQFALLFTESLYHLLSLAPSGSKNTVGLVWWDVVILCLLASPFYVDEERRIKDRLTTSLTQPGISGYPNSSFLLDIRIFRLTNLFYGLFQQCFCIWILQKLGGLFHVLKKSLRYIWFYVIRLLKLMHFHFGCPGEQKITASQMCCGPFLLASGSLLNTMEVKLNRTPVLTQANCVYTYIVS